MTSGLGFLRKFLLAESLYICFQNLILNQEVVAYFVIYHGTTFDYARWASQSASGQWPCCYASLRIPRKVNIYGKPMRSRIVQIISSADERTLSVIQTTKLWSFFMEFVTLLHCNIVALRNFCICGVENCKKSNMEMW